MMHATKTRWTRGGYLAVVLAMAACGGKDGGEVGPDGEADGQAGDGVTEPDVALDGDPSPDGGPDTGPVEDATPDAGPDGEDGLAVDTGGGDADAGPEPGRFGWPCERNDECDSGYCLEAYGGRVCSDVCDGSCADGWSCRQDITVFPDVVFVCVPSFPSACRPCDDHDVCDDGGTSAGSRCIPRPDPSEGAFCGGACAAAACPPGYACEAATDIDGEVTLQCVPEGGAACECSSAAVAESASTACVFENAFGRCEGRRVCGAGGLGDCDVRAPALDLCNGLDDDCDGEVDEAFVPEACEAADDSGACGGVTVCDGEDGVRCIVPTPEPERCGDAIDNDCDGQTDEPGAAGCRARFEDVDGDGWGTGEALCLCRVEGARTAERGGDCQDEDGNINPGATESCNLVDDDCDDEIDGEGSIGCTPYFRDGDGDGFGDSDDVRCLCAPDEETRHVTRVPGDCDDVNPAINPGAAEVCGGGDEDCDGVVDEGGAGNCTLHYADGDEDTWGDPGLFACQCAPSAAYPSPRGGDCDDGDAATNPDALEVCDEADNDCNGRIDELNAEGCTPYYRDSDRDGFGVATDVRCTCAPEGVWDTTVPGDCNDAADSIGPGSPETCNGQDDDCDGEVDEAGAEGCQLYYEDRDFDTFGAAAGGDESAACLCGPSEPWLATNADDCDDGDPFANPGAREVCNSKDDNCNDAIDEGVEATCSPFYYDADGDGWGIESDSRCLCAPEGLYRAVRFGDCADDDPDRFPYARESCNEVDDDCDDSVDEAGALGCVAFFGDGDEDGFGAGRSRCLCGPEGSFTASVGGDCADDDPAVNPDAEEACNSLDDDCDGDIDEADSLGCDLWLRDSDQDGFGVEEDRLCLCGPLAPYSAKDGGDCNDAAAAVNPEGVETCNGRDDDCNGTIDDPGIDGCFDFSRDADADSFGAEGDVLCLCGPLGEYRATDDTDCDDDDLAVNPAAAELCNDVDDDCNGLTDEAGARGCAIWLRDVDGDDYGVDGDLRCLCEPDGTYRAQVGGDCNDGAEAANPGAPELCGGGDDDCDGVTDEEGAGGCELWYRDADGDGFGVRGSGRCLCAASGSLRAEVDGDCNDGNADIAPGAVEACNSVDDDCDGDIDEEGAVGCRPFFLDADGDGAGVGESRCLCAPEGEWRAPVGGDCADADPGRSPLEDEACGGDGVDEDCDGLTDEENAIGCVDRFEDADGDGYGVTVSRRCYCDDVGDWTAEESGDCDDGSDAVSPAGTEVCNGVDDDCDGGFDEGCGIQAGGWPTAKFDVRRTGFGQPYAGPLGSTVNVPSGSQRAAPAMRWRRRLGTASIATSPLFDAAGDLIIAVGAKVYKLDPADGTSIWEADLPAAMSSGASPTLREGGTIAVPSGNGMVLLDADGERLWYTKLPGPDAEPITGSPMVDADGTIYTVGYSAAYAISPAGEVEWSVSVPNSQYVPSHVAYNPDNDRLYFGCSNHTLFALTRAGQIAWTYVVLDVDVDASTTIGFDGALYQTFGNNFHKVRDDGNRGTFLASANGGGDLDAHLTLWRDAGGNEHVLSNANGNSGVRSHRASDLNRSWTYSMTKDQSGNATAAIDTDGRVYVGDDAGGFHCIAPNGARIWRFALNSVSNPSLGGGVKSASALQAGAVFFGDTAGWLVALSD